MNKMTQEQEKAIELVNSFIELNHSHALETSEEYGMSYAYHVKCAMLLVDERLKGGMFKGFWEGVKKVLENMLEECPNSKFELANIISELENDTPQYDNEFIEELKHTNIKFNLTDLFVSYKTGSYDGHFRCAGREKYLFLSYIKQNYLK
jgi:hypothetical protein